MSNALEDALNAVANMNREHPFAIGQPLWIKSNMGADDSRTFIAIGFSRGFIGNWMVDLVPEYDLNAHPILIPVRYLTSIMPEYEEIHPDQMGRIYATGTGWEIKSIEGGIV